MAFAPVFQRPFSATFSRAAAAAAAGNGLLNNLIAYWPLNETSGNALDAHTGGKTLTPAGVTGAAAGLVYPGARTVNIGLFYRSDAALSASGDMTIAAWFYRTAVVGNETIVSKWGLDAGTEHEYWLYNHVNNGESRFECSSNGVDIVSVARPALPNNQWNLMIAWYDSLDGTINLQTNGGTVSSTAFAGPLYNGSTAFNVGVNGTNNWYIGRIGPVAFWKSAAGGGGVLTAAQRTALYNGGAGLAYAQFTA